MDDRGLQRALILAAWGLYGDRWVIRAQDIAAVDRAQRILRGEGSSRLWMSLASGALDWHAKVLGFK